MTDKKDCMTMEQAEQKMECLREVFSIVRLVDGEMLEKRAEHSADADADAMEMCQCYSFWNKAKPCENCISMKSLREKTGSEAGISGFGYFSGVFKICGG